MKVLHLNSSIQGDASVSRTLSAAIIDRLRETHPALDITYRDLAADPLSHATVAGFATGQAQEVLDEFLSTDIVVIGAPMYNFGISSQLKSWFDHILIPGKTFRYTESGVEGFAAGKRAIVALSRGNVYSAGSPAAPSEHAESHLRAMLAFIGISDIEFVIAEGVALGPEQREAALESALAQVKRLGPPALAA